MMQETMIETTVNYTIEYQGQLYLIEQVPARVAKHARTTRAPRSDP